MRHLRTILTALVVTAVSLVGFSPTVQAAPNERSGLQSWNLDVDAPASYEDQLLAQANTAGFTCHRIPALTTANNGWVLAAWDGRPGTCADAPQPNSIIQRISKDGGKTWGAVETIAAGNPNPSQRGFSDPSYVVDRQTGRIFNFFVMSYDWGWPHRNSTITTDRQVMHAVYIYSDDNGATWSEPVKVTDALNPEPRNATWTGRFAASGEGIQLKYGSLAGRLVQQYTVYNTVTDDNWAVSLYSDDHGATWKAGAPVGPGMDENKVVELSDGRLMLNSRTSDGNRARYVAYSSDGGQTWTPRKLDPQLIDPVNNASIIRAFPNAPQGSAEAKVLLFSNAYSVSGRANGAIRVSFDDGVTWPDTKVFQSGAMSYSTLTTLADGSLGLLYENTGSTIRFAKLTWAWLGTSGAALSAPNPTVHRGANSLGVHIANNGFGAELAAGQLELVPTSGVSGTPVAVPAIARGANATVQLPVTLASTVDEGPLTLRLKYQSGERSVERNIEVRVELGAADKRSEVIPQAGLRIVGTPPAQAGEGPERMLDGDPATLWHTPYSGTTLPTGVTVDLGAAYPLASVQITPRPSGSNGSIGGYRVLVGTTPDALTLAESGTWANDQQAKRVFLSGAEVRYVRVEAVTTYGDRANTWVSIAEFTARKVSEASAPSGMLNVVTTVRSAAKEYYRPGDKVQISVQVTNQSTQSIHAVPRAGAWENLFPTCRWRNLAAGASYSCGATGATAANPPSYTLTQADVDRGYFVPVTTWAAAQGADVTGASPLQEQTFEGPRVALPTVAVRNLGPVETPKVIKAGTALRYVFEYQNTTAGTLAVIPKTGEFAGFAITGTPNCRWGALASGATVRCTTATYTVTDADVAAGFVQPPASFTIARDRAGTQALFALDVTAPRTAVPVFRPAVTAEPVVAGAQATISLTGFYPQAEITLTVAGERVASVSADGDGAATAKFTVPAATEAGTLRVVATQDNLSAGTDVRVYHGTMSLDRTSAAQQDKVTATLAGFRPATEVTVSLGAVLASATTDAEGAAQVVFEVPATQLPGEHQVVANQAGGVTASATLTVSAAAVTFTMPAGDLVVGEPFTVTGAGFVPGEQVRLELHSDPIILAVQSADLDGKVSLTGTVPPSAPAGDHQLVLVALTSGRSAAVPVVVRPSAGPAVVQPPSGPVVEPVAPKPVNQRPLPVTGGEASLLLGLAGLAALGVAVVRRARR